MNKINSITAIFSLIPILLILVVINYGTINNSSTVEISLPDHDAQSLNNIRKIFNIEADPVLLIIRRDDAQFNSERLKNLESALSTIQGVTHVLSSYSELVEKGKNKEILQTDHLTELFILSLDQNRTDLTQIQSFISALKSTLVIHLDKTETASITGLPSIRLASWQIAKDDFNTIFPLILLTVIVVSHLCFASYTVTLITILVTAVTSCLCLLLHYAIFQEINALIILMIPFVWAIATLDVYHLYERTRQLALKGTQTPAITARNQLVIPCGLTTLTTALCFATLLLTNASPLIITISVWGISGAVFALILTLTIGVKLLTTMPFDAFKETRLVNFTTRIVRFSQERALVVVLFWLFVTVVVVLNINRLEVKNHYPNVFSSNEEITQEITFMQEVTRTDMAPVEILITPTDDDGNNIQALLSAMLAMSNYAATIDETRFRFPYDFVSDKILTTYSKSMISTAQIEQELTENWRNWISEHQGEYVGRIQLHFAPMSFERKQEVISWINHFDRTMLSHHQLGLTGPGYLYPLIEQRGKKDLLTTSVIALSLILITIGWISRRFVVVLIALPGVLIPVGFMLAWMSLVGISWSVTLLLIPAIFIGLIADDIIHLLWPLRESKNFQHELLLKSASEAAPALLATSLVLALVITTLILSGMKVNQEIGTLLPIGITVAFICNLSVIPALCQLFIKTVPSSGEMSD